jgi:hypothetical protein
VTGKAVDAAAAYQRPSPSRLIPTRWVFTGVYRTLRHTGALTAEGDANQDVDMQYNIVQMAERRLTAITRRSARRLDVQHTRLWRTLQAEGVYPYHVQWVQHLGPGDLSQRLEFCRWLNGNGRFIVTSCLLTKRNSIATVSLTQTNTSQYNYYIYTVQRSFKKMILVLCALITTDEHNILCTYEYDCTCILCSVATFIEFFSSNATTCPYRLRGLPSWFWRKCNRLLRLGRP